MYRSPRNREKDHAQKNSGITTKAAVIASAFAAPRALKAFTLSRSLPAARRGQMAAQSKARSEASSDGSTFESLGSSLARSSLCGEVGRLDTLDAGAIHVPRARLPYVS